MNIFKTVAAGFALTIALPAVAAPHHQLRSTAQWHDLAEQRHDDQHAICVARRYLLRSQQRDRHTGPLNAWAFHCGHGPGGSGNYLGSFGEISPSPIVPGPSDYLLAPRYDVMSLLFTGPVSGISFGLNTMGGQNSVTINAYDALGVQLLMSAGRHGQPGRLRYQDAVGERRRQGRHHRRLQQSVFGPDLRIDNLSFTVDPPAVPEPATWAMMIAGFGLTGAAMRRSRTRTAVSFG